MQYYVAVEAGVTSVAISAISSQGTRCIGQYGRYSNNGSYSYNCRNAALVSYTSGSSTWPASTDRLEQIVFPPMVGVEPSCRVG